MDFVRIDRFTSRVEADMSCQMLKARGFDAHVSADDVAGIHPDIPFGIGGTAVVVPRDQYDDAIALLDDEFSGPLDFHDDNDVAFEDHGARNADAGRSAQRQFGADESTGEHGSTVGDEAAEDDDALEWRTADRRRGLPAVALGGAILMLVVYAASTRVGIPWWG